MTTGQYPVRWADGCAFGLSDTGVVRKANEDAFLVDESLGLLIVADGMGGHADGARASREAIAAVQSALTEPGSGAFVSDETIRIHLGDPDDTWPMTTMPALTAVFDAVEAANRRVFALNCEAGAEEGSGMGTTLVGLWHDATSNCVLAFHVGDSRLYCLRGGRLTQLTRDHSAYQEAVDAGLVQNLPRRNVLTRAIGPGQDVVPDVRLIHSEPGDVYLLCSDGVHGAIPDEAIAGALAAAADGDLQSACTRLLELAVTCGSRDNATVVLARRDSLAGIDVVPR